ncbi:MAG TPA: hypothetical protein VMH26_17555, partial [Burkholderiales bacterium]|nr:hypothetical protein [Burkholderiales bacterium]
SLIAELLAAELVTEDVMRQELDGDIATQLLILGPIDDTHAARADLFNQAIVAEDLPDIGNWE